jgi:hypothetical protein
MSIGSYKGKGEIVLTQMQNDFGRVKANELHKLLNRIIENSDIRIVFQPIISLRDGAILGYEALSRGPAGSPLENPDTLFGVAAESGKLWELEQLCRTKALEAAYTNNLTIKLFLNVNPSVIHDVKFKNGFTREYLLEYNIDPSNIFFEISEKNAVENLSGFIMTIEHYKNQNYKIAVDGSVGTTYAEEKYSAERLEIIKKTNAIAFANFAEFDYPDDTLKVLDITMKEYKEQLNNLNLTPRWYGGQKSLDHAQMVLYQWTYYNPSLTLYSRNLVYDQDFFSKASLTIEPRFVRGTKSYPVFAEPFIFTDSLPTDRFLIDSGVKVNITAKESIRIKPGFYAKKGSICRIKIISDKDKE